MASFVPRAIFPTLHSLPRSYYLGHHAAGLSKMKSLLSQIDLIIECRDQRIPLTSRNPLFEESLGERERMIVYTKNDLGNTGSAEDLKRHELLRQCHRPSEVVFSDYKNRKDIKRILDLIKRASRSRGALTGSHLMVVGMPNVGKSTLLNALRHEGVGKGKASHTGAQPGVTRKISTGVKIVDADEAGSGSVYLLDTPGVFMPYVPDSDAMLKLALCGSVKDNIIPAPSLADYLLFHINLHDPHIYSEYSAPTNDITELLDAIAQKIGRLQKGGTPDLEGTALWMIQRWRNGHLGIFTLDDVTDDVLAAWRSESSTSTSSLNQARKASKDAIRMEARARRIRAGIK